MNNKVAITYTYWRIEQIMIKHAIFLRKKLAIKKKMKGDFECILLGMKSCLKNIIKTTLFYHHIKS